MLLGNGGQFAGQGRGRQCPPQGLLGIGLAPVGLLRQAKPQPPAPFIRGQAGGPRIMAGSLAMSSLTGFEMPLKTGVIGASLGMGLRARQGMLGGGKIALLQLQSGQRHRPADLARLQLQPLAQHPDRLAELARLQQ